MTYLNAFFHLVNFSCVIFHLFSHAVQVLCHATYCSRHNIYVFGSILDCFLQSPNRLNTIFFQIFLYPHFLSDEYVTKELLIEEMYLSNKRQRIEQVPNGVSLKTWVRSVQEAGFVLGEIKTKTATSLRARSRFVLQAKLLALEMKALPKDANVDVLIADVPKGERNRNLTKNKYSIQCPSFGLSSCTKTFFVAKKWWDIRPLNSDLTSNQISVHWSSHFKGLYYNKKITLSVMKMADNHLRNLYFHRQINHGGTSFPYFD